MIENDNLTEKGQQILDWVRADDVLVTHEGLSQVESHAAWLAIHSLRGEAVCSALEAELSSRREVTEHSLDMLQKDLAVIELAQQIVQNNGNSVIYEKEEAVQTQDYRFLPEVSVVVGSNKGEDDGYVILSAKEDRQFSAMVKSLIEATPKNSGRIPNLLYRTGNLSPDFFTVSRTEDDKVMVTFKGTDEAVPTKEDLFINSRNIGDITMTNLLNLFWALAREQEQQDLHT